MTGRLTRSRPWLRDGETSLERGVLDKRLQMESEVCFRESTRLPEAADHRCVTRFHATKHFALSHINRDLE